MGRVKQRISWLAGGGASVRAALDEQTAAIQELQRKVADLTVVVARLDAGSSDGESWATLRDDVRRAVDDLGARIGALAERVERLEA